MAITEGAALTVAKVGGVSTGLFASAVIFTDPAFMWMSLVGAIISVISTFHTIFSDVNTKFTKMQRISELLKGFVLGLVAMPLGFLLISEGIFSKLIGIELGALSLSLSFVSAFLFSWFMIPIVDTILIKFKKGDRTSRYEHDYMNYRDYTDYRKDDYDNSNY
ncbi:MAG TPA: hypothetical protein EYG98_03040 [Sulfurovum sp.]|nr:hypothetical protein [Sulfurovum sp.]